MTTQGVAAGDPPAPELMDRVYRHQRHIYDLTRKYFLLGRDHLIRRLEVPAGGHVLELGCGTGRNLIAAARAYPDAHLYGVDVSRQMLATAARNVARAGLEHRVRLAFGDASGFDPAPSFGQQAFDRVFFSYSLSMIPPWRAALAQGARLVRPGGRLALVDFGHQEQLPGWFCGLLHAWLAKFHVSPRGELQEELQSVAQAIAARASFTPLHRGYAWYAEIRRPT